LKDQQRPFVKAVRQFWATREKQAKSQRARGGSDQGSRSAVTGGKQMDGFVQAIKEAARKAGVAPSDIYTSKDKTIPGFYRPTKEWDILVVVRGRLLAAIELKSQVGSFGNNFNNRTEEALGVACDTWTAYRQGAYGASSDPWLGYLFLLEDCPRSRQPITHVDEPHYRVFDEFREASYAKRYELFCRKLVLERQYSAACFILADKDKAKTPDNYMEPNPELSSAGFLAEFIRRVRQD